MKHLSIIFLTLLVLITNINSIYAKDDDSKLLELQEEVNLAKKTLDSAEKDLNNKLSALEAAKESLSNAQDAYDTISGQKDKADYDLANATSAKETTDKAYEEAKTALDNAQKAYDAAVEGGQSEEIQKANEALIAAQDALKVVEDNLNAKKEETKAAKDALIDATDNLNSAKSDVSNTENTIKSKEDNVKLVEDSAKSFESDIIANDEANISKAQDKVDTAQGELDIAISDQTNAKTTQDEAQAAVDAAKKVVDSYADGTKKEELEAAVTAAKNKIAEGSLGFFESLGEEGTAAVNVLTGKDKYTTSKDLSYTNLGAENDATALDNMKRAIEVMMQGQKYRVNDRDADGNPYNLSEQTVSNELMANAQVNANGSNYYATTSGLDHLASGNIRCENAASGYENPYRGWYYQEKAYYLLQVWANQGITGDELNQ